MTAQPPRARSRLPSRNSIRLIVLLIAAGVIGAVLASRPSTDPETLAAQVREYARDFKVEDALRTAQDALDIVRSGGYPDEYIAKFHLLRGQMWLMVYEWDYALNDYDTAVDLAPDYPEAYYLRGVFYATRTELDLAIADFERVVILDPDGRFVEQARAAINDLTQQREALGQG